MPRNHNISQKQSKPFVFRCRVQIDSQCLTREIAERLTPFIEGSQTKYVIGNYLRKQKKAGQTVIDFRTDMGVWQVELCGRRGGCYLWDLYFISPYCIAS
ncbi:MAG: hypothetical protein ACFB2X_09275 [Rivularia sp. (in: cyanobacteria)]